MKTMECQLGSDAVIGDRESQQDTCMSRKINSSRRGQVYVLAMADGVGGEVAGEVASSLACETFLGFVHDRFDKYDYRALLSHALDAANKAIAKAVRSNRRYSGMATTFVGVLLVDRRMYWISTGDSHLYYVHKGRLSKLNEDHSLGALLDREFELGHITREEYENFPNRNVILSCLSGANIEKIDLPKKHKPLSSQDRVILASDGLDTLSEQEVAEISVRSTNPEDCARALTKSVLDHKKPYQDNTAVLVADVTF